jgi:hypothetical protein
MGAELFYADTRTDRQTNMTKPIAAFRNFANALKNVILDIISGQRSAACYVTG